MSRGPGQAPTINVTFRLSHIVAGVPTANGRIYPRQVLQRMADKANEGNFPILDSRVAPTQSLYRGELVGTVRRSHFDGECLVIDAMIVEGVVMPSAIDIAADGVLRETIGGMVVDEAKLSYLRAVDPSVLRVPGESRVALDAMLVEIAEEEIF